MPARWAAFDSGAAALLTLVGDTFEPAVADDLPTDLRTVFTSPGPQTTPVSGEGVPMLTYDDYMSLSSDTGRLAVVEGVALQDETQGAPGPSVPRFVDAQTDKAIAVLNLHTGAIATLTDPDILAVSPAWSPDGETIAFVARTDTGPVQPGDRTAEDARRIWTMASDGADAHPLPIDGAGCRHELPRWSGDGKHLLFVCLNGDHASLMLVPADGGTAVEVVDKISIAALDGSGQQPAFPEYQGHISWNAYFDWWQP